MSRSPSLSMVVMKPRPPPAPPGGPMVRHHRRMQTAALAGLRVLDISTFLAAPQVSAMLGDFGADVIKLEPPGGEPLRRIGAQRNGASLSWAMASRNKRTITCDLGAEEGRDLLR